MLAPPRVKDEEGTGMSWPGRMFFVLKPKHSGSFDTILAILLKAAVEPARDTAAVWLRHRPLACAINVAQILHTGYRRRSRKTPMQGDRFMSTHIFTACGVLVVAGLTASAQTPQTTPSQPTSPATSQKPMDAGGPVTVTGCLAAWDGKSMSSSGPGTDAGSAAASSARASGATGAGASYVLTSVQQGTGSASTTSSASSASVAGKYLLKADSTVNLSAHLNHKVTVTGTLDKMSAHTGSDVSANAPSSTDPPRTDKPATASESAGAHDMGSMKPQTLKVTSVTMVSATCP